MGNYMLEMKLVKMKLAVFGSKEGEFVPCFNLERAADKMDEEFVSTVEKSTSMNIGEISDKEYLSHHAIGGTMPRFNRVFEEMKVTYGERKILDKVLKSIEDKVAKAAKSTAQPIATMRAESKKRKGSDGPKVVAKKRKSLKTSKDSAAEEMAESGYDGSATTQASTEASAARMDEDLMGSYFQIAGGAPDAGARNVAPFPSVLGEDSSSCEEIVADDVSASESGSEEVASGRLGRSTKTPHLEQSEVESEEHPPSAHPPSPAPVGTPPRTAGDTAVGDTQGILYLSECFFLFFRFIGFCSPFLCIF
jgi:hypothetical protein